MRKKLFFILALLLTAVTGAWADDGIHCTASDVGRVVCTDGSIYDNVSAAEADGKTAVAMIVYLDRENKKGLALALADEGQMNWSTAMSTCSAKTPTVTGGTWKLATRDEWDTMISAAGGYTALRDGFSSVGGTNLQSDPYWSSTVYDNFASNYGFRYGSWYYEHMSFPYYVRACLAFDFTAPDWPTQGTTGTEDDPYLISSEDDWNAFCSSVSSGNSYSGQYVKLTSDISVSTMANGTFSGTFDGDGKTINANISGSGSMALFGSLNGGTIKNLKLTGSVSGDIHTAALLVSLGNSGTNIIENCVVTANVNCSSTHMGGFLAHGNSSNITMRGCVFKGKMTGGSSAKGVFYGWGDNGGTGSVTDCLYIMASGQDTNGLDLTKGSGTITVTNSYRTANACSHGTMANVTDQTPTNIGSLVQGYGFMNAYQHGILFDGLYYVDPNYAPAFQLLKAATASDIGKVVCAAGHLHPAKAAVPDGCTAVGILGKVPGYGLGLILALHDASNQTWETINGWTSVTTYAGTTLKLLPDDGARGSLTSYFWLGDILDHIMVSNWCVAQKSDYEAIFENLGSTTGNDIGKTYDANVNAYITGAGGTALDGMYWSATEGYENYHGWGFDLSWHTQHKAYYESVRPVLGFTFIASELPGTGTAGDPYTISNSDEWINFVYNVNNGNSYNGKYVKLTADISVTTPVGYRESDSDNKPFSGTFLGDGHTITAALAIDGKQGLAPFRCINGATIRDLKVAGTIASNQNHTAGIAGFASGTNTIEDCLVTATLNISSDYAGGIIGHGLTSATTIRGCAFTGTVNGVDGNRSNVGGLWGWSDSATPALVNCLEAGTYTNIASMHPMGLQGGSGTITNCYYLNAQTGSPRNVCTVSGAKQAYTAATAPANLGSEVQDYGTLTAYENGILYDGTYYVAPATVTLADNADNSTTISNANGYVANVTLAARTLYKDGAWNTLCLPFDVTIAGSPLAGATARPLKEGSISGTTLNLYFDDNVTTLVAGTPYIIKWESGDNIVSPVFAGVTIDGTDRSYDNHASGDSRVRFAGTYKSTAFTSEDKSILFMGGENTLYYPSKDATIGAQRAYFKIGDDGAMLAKRLTAFNINFGDDETTGIEEIDNLTIHNSQFEDGAWFTLDGRKLYGKPTQRGIYVNNGKKVAIK